MSDAQRTQCLVYTPLRLAILRTLLLAKTLARPCPIVVASSVVCGRPCVCHAFPVVHTVPHAIVANMPPVCRVCNAVYKTTGGLVGGVVFVEGRSCMWPETPLTTPQQRPGATMANKTHTRHTLMAFVSVCRPAKCGKERRVCVCVCMRPFADVGGHPIATTRCIHKR